MPYECISFSIIDKVAHLVLNHPATLNAMQPVLWRELTYTGRRMPAQRALAVGLVNEVFETQEAMVEGALQMAREIAEKPPVAIWGSKQAIHYARDHSTRDALQQMGWLQ